MSDFASLLVPALGATLLHFVWQGVLIGAIAALALWVLRDARPQARYLVASLALLACALVPLATLGLQVAALMSEDLAEASLALTLADARTPPLTQVANEAAASIGGLDALLPWIVAAWASGAALGMFRMAWGLAWIRHLHPDASPALQAAWQQRLDVLAVHYRLGRRVVLRIVDHLDTPAAIGWFRPVVLLPAAVIARLPADLVEALLAHELAHVRRHDYLVNLLQTALEALLFYHPVVWALSRCVRDERERIADRLAAEVSTPPRKLARALSALADLRADALPPHLALAANGGPLMSRIQQLLKPLGPARSGAGVALSLAALVTACALSFAYAHAGQGADRFVTADESATTERSTRTSSTTARSTHASTIRMHKDEDETFALVDPASDGITMWGSIEHIDAINAAKRNARGEFLWVRRGGKTYVVSDPAVIARAHDAWRDSDAIDAKMEVLDEQMEAHSDRVEALGEEMEALSENVDPSPEFEAAQRQMEDLARRQEEIGREQEAIARRQERIEDHDSAQARQLEKEMDALDAKMEALEPLQDRLEAVMDAESERRDQHQVPMEALSRRMEEASRPMEELSRQMEALGEQQEAASEKALIALRRLVDDAIARGLARPAS